MSNKGPLWNVGVEQGPVAGANPDLYPVVNIVDVTRHNEFRERLKVELTWVRRRDKTVAVTRNAEFTDPRQVDEWLQRQGVLINSHTRRVD